MIYKHPHSQEITRWGFKVKRLYPLSHARAQLPLKHTFRQACSHLLPGHMLLLKTKTTAFFDNGRVKC